MSGNFNETENSMQGFSFVAGGADKRILSGKQKAAMLMGELSGYTNALVPFLSTKEISMLRKSIKKLGKKVEIPSEIKMLEEVNRFGVSRKICSPKPSLFNSALYAEENENKKSRDYLSGLFKNPDAVANVISVWLKED